MSASHGFHLLHEQSIPELRIAAALYRHEQTGAELLSLRADDPNKVFCITFRTPPRDSTGVPHILEHAVLCGSRKYPVKEPFVELLKGSLHTFLNACTYPDKTCYPVASQNLRDFYNLIDVYCDAVFHPLLSPVVFRQEGWHYVVAQPAGALAYKGVVFNEMKGAYSSPENLLAHYCQEALFPDTLYRFDAGGDPEKIPSLTYKQFMDFHRAYYHPSNCTISFYGDDDPQERLRFMDGYLREFDRREACVATPQQPRRHEPRRMVRTFPAGALSEGDGKGMAAVNWLLPAIRDPDAVLTFSVLEYVLLGMTASPLRTALLDAGLGEGLAGVGLESDLAQMYLSTGLKGVAAGRLDEVEPLVLDSLAAIARNGIDPRTLQAALNTIEFRLRENNSGRLPRGLLLLLRSLPLWLAGGNPCDMIAFAAPLERLQRRLSAEPRLFEHLIETFLLQNLHRATVLLSPDPELGPRREREEQERLSRVAAALSPEARAAVMAEAEEVAVWQRTPDAPEALAAIPRLHVSDLDRCNLTTPTDCSTIRGARVLFHDLFTSGICYVDVGLNLHLLPQDRIALVPLLGRALLETGTAAENFVALSQRIGQTTGGITTSTFASAVHGERSGCAWLFLRGKAMHRQVPELFSILADVLLSARLDDRDRVLQILAEEKAGQEQMLIPHGHQIIGSRLRARYHEADWADEQMNGSGYLACLRRLEQNRDKTEELLGAMRERLVSRPALVVNVTTDTSSWRAIQPQVHEFLDRIPDRGAQTVRWQPEPLPPGEGLCAPTMVNFVGKAVNLYHQQYAYHGSMQVMTHLVRTTWLWDQVRVQGGAYGAFCSFDRMSGSLVFVSYRDPRLLETLAVFDRTAEFLRSRAGAAEDIERSIIGTISDIDQPLLPDARGFVALQRYLNGNSDQLRQQMREEILSTGPDDLRLLADMLESLRDRGSIAVLAAPERIREANRLLNGLLQEQPLL